MTRRLWPLVSLFLGAATPAAAQDGVELFSPATLGASFDIRLVAADGERSWLDGGFGKARFGPDRASPGGLRPDVEPVEAALVWQPRFGWTLGGTVVAIAQQGGEHAVDLSEAFLAWKPKPSGAVRFGARAGLMWPPISLEHSGAEWWVTDTITPSAINSWIGDEVKLLGAEGSTTLTSGRNKVTATAAIFAFDDTAGTLLAFRGWALHDQKATAFGRQPLPPLNDFLRYAQAPATRPVLEIDHRPGYYLKLAWQPPVPVRIEASYYDNRGNPQAVNDELQWGWRTRFTNLGLRAELPGNLTLRAQAMGGRTEMGFPRSGVIWVDTRFHSAFAMATQDFGRGAVSTRVEAFDTRNHGSITTAIDDENGWAVTTAVRRSLGTRFTLVGEALRVDSTRAARLRAKLAPHQAQTVLQLSLRAQL